MKVQIKKEDILERLSFLESIISEKNVKEILSHILIEAEGESVTLTVTNLETALKCSVSAKVEKAGNISILANKFSSIVRNLSKDALIDIKSSDNNKIELTSSTKYKVDTQGFTKDDFPTIHEPEFSTSITIAQSLLKDLLRKTFFSSLKLDNNKPFLNGIFLKIKGELISAVGSDGYRLSYVTRKISQPCNEEMSVIIPNKTANELLKILNSSTGEVTIALSKKEVLFKIDDILFLSRIIEEKFPKFDQVIPNEFNHRIILNIKELESGLNLVKPMVDEKTKRLNIDLSKDKLELKASSDYGQSKFEIPIVFNGDNLSIPFNIEYISEFIKVLESDRIFMDVINEKSQILFKPESDDDHLYITMPMRF